MKIKKRTGEYIVEATKKRVFVARNKPALVINQKGIEDNSTYFGIGFLAWDEIEKIVIHEFDEIYIGIIPYDSDKFKGKASLVKKIGILINQKVAIQAPFNIPAANLKGPFLHILSQLLVHIPSDQEDKLSGFPIELLASEFPEAIELVENLR